MGGRGATPELQFLLELLPRPNAIFALCPLASFFATTPFTVSTSTVKDKTSTLPLWVLQVAWAKTATEVRVAFVCGRAFLF